MKDKVIESPRVIQYLDGELAGKEDLLQKKQEFQKNYKNATEKEKQKKSNLKTIESFVADIEAEEDKKSLINLYKDLKRADYIDTEDKREAFALLKKKGVDFKTGKGDIDDEEI